MSESQSQNAWSEELEDKLVTLWQEKPCLFNCTIREYSNKIVKSRAVQEISDIHTYIHTYTHTYLHTYIHIHYTHIYIYTYIHIYIYLNAPVRVGSSYRVGYYFIYFPVVVQNTGKRVVLQVHGSVEVCRITISRYL